jgi:hypothetical protein
MPPSLTLVHTAPALQPTFVGLLQELAPDIPVHHLVEADLLQQARQHGAEAPQVRKHVAQALATAAQDHAAAVVLCTCSSIGAAAEAAQIGRPVLRVDRAMAQEAVARGPRILVAAALASTVGPTRELILDAADKAGKKVELIDVDCSAAWPCFEQGDTDGYYTGIATALRQAVRQGDVAILAQASMAPAADLCADLPIAVLSSPRLGIQAAIAAYRQATA